MLPSIGKEEPSSLYVADVEGMHIYLELGWGICYLAPVTRHRSQSYDSEACWCWHFENGSIFPDRMHDDQVQGTSVDNLKARLCTHMAR